MTLIHIDLRGPDGTPASGSVLFSPTARLHLEDDGEDYIQLPTPFVVLLVNGTADVELMPTDADWAWSVIERTKRGIRRYLYVPDTSSVLEYGDLVDVDPDTLTPTAEPEAAWWLALENLDLAPALEQYLDAHPLEGATTDYVTTAIEDHTNSPTPHPTYDDIPSMTLIFENGLV